MFCNIVPDGFYAVDFLDAQFIEYRFVLCGFVGVDAENLVRPNEYLIVSFARPKSKVDCAIVSEQFGVSVHDGFCIDPWKTVEIVHVFVEWICGTFAQLLFDIAMGPRFEDEECRLIHSGCQATKYAMNILSRNVDSEDVIAVLSNSGRVSFVDAT
jgi:hypothetical protein